ncbi:hypothetical protein [Pandoraea anhela]|uniref:hypothetical protein n=1 Tax=Pandoraea anhela TaxID=2508295 RepID=UPI00124151D9|nr:hypothetical protein [Pandoraea anhela]
MAPAVAPPVSRLADLPNVANADERYSAWIKLLYDEASTTARMTPRQLSPFADALDDLHERHRPFAAEFLIVFLRDFYVSNKPGELATYVGEVFDAMKRPACATALVRGFFDCTATVFGDKQHLVATGILTHLDRRMQSDADRLWRATAIWSLGFMRPEQRYDAWESAFTRLRHRLSTACVADIGLHASAIGLIPAGDQQQRAAGQLVRFIVMSLKRLDARDARMTFVCDALSAISDKAVRADIAERLMERASADNSASRDEVTRVISERLDMFDPGTGFHFLSLLSRTGKSAQSEKS